MELETKIIYHIDDEDTPYLVKVPVSPDRVTLGDFKNVLNKPNCKYFFKSMDDDFGVVKEEITDDTLNLPCFNGRVVSWLVTADGSDAGSHGSDSVSHKGSVDGKTERHLEGGSLNFHNATGETETESMASSQRANRRPHTKPATLTRHEFGPRLNGHGPQGGKPGALGGRHHQHLYQETTNSSMMSSDLESTSYWDSDDDLTCSRFSATTETTSKSRGSRFKKRRRKHRVPPPMDRASSFSSITDSTLSLNIITVTLNMDTVNFLGISIVGQSNKGGDGGIYVGSIMKGGAVAQDGRIEPGDMILQVNEVSLENMSNDEAVGVLRDAVQKPAPIKLVVAKCWDPSPRGYFTVPRQEPVRPIDPSAWVAHTEAVRLQQHSDYGSLGPVPPGAVPMATNVNGGSLMAVPLGVAPSSVGGMPITRLGHGGSTSAPPGVYPPRPGPLSPSLTDLNSTSSSFNSAPEAERLYEDLNLTLNTDMAVVAKAMAVPDSGLEIRDRMWLKITIPNAFIGSDVVDWLFNHVAGFSDRRDARKYATQMLKQGFIRHTVNKSSFSEQCYYVMSPLILELCGNMSALNIDDNLDSVSERAAATAAAAAACGASTTTATNAGNVVMSEAQCRQMNNPIAAGPVPMSCPPTTYYQGPPYMMGAGPGGGGSYAPPPMSYTPMPYVTGNYDGGGGGDAGGYRATPVNGGVVVDGGGGGGVLGFRPMGGGGVGGGGGGLRTTGVGGSETSVASGVSNASSSQQSVDSVCAANKTDETEGVRLEQRLTPSAPTREFLEAADSSSPPLNNNNNNNNNNNASKYSPSTALAASSSSSCGVATTPTTTASTTYFSSATSPLSPFKSSSVTPTASQAPALSSPPPPQPRTLDAEGGGGGGGGIKEGGGEGGFSSAGRASTVGERPPTTGGGVGESSTPSPPLPSSTPLATPTAAAASSNPSSSANVVSPGRFKPSFSSSGNPPSYQDVVSSTRHS